MAKEKTVELKPKLEKISEEHLKGLQDVVNSVNNLQFQIGQLESRKHNLLHELVLGQDSIVKMQNLFSKEYGSYDINIKDGTINWNEDEK
jgi:allophanate hydrolase subunit 1